MTTFEGMCIGFLSGVVGTLICVLGGALIDQYINHDGSGDADISIGSGDRRGDNGQDNID